MWVFEDALLAPLQKLQTQSLKCKERCPYGKCVGKGSQSGVAGGGCMPLRDYSPKCG